MEFRPIHKLLIANRGEIAERIMRTCESMGIATVAVFSDADADARFVRRADEAFRLGAAPSSESYLRIDVILEAAKLSGADAIHPGFGFLAENAEFARACEEAGVIFVGPSPAAIQSMGSKREAKRIAEEAGVPVIPGYNGESQEPEVLAAKAKEMGFPVLVKASAGGGGKGMRIVRAAEDVEAAIDGAKREAEKSFGDGTLLIEKYIERPRHVEIQILGDHHGELLHIHERECSIQRRHQKIIEESPSPALTPELRQRMGEAAVKLGEAIGYTNAGTVEMILAPDGAFYFLEVNTRLQVEHPVTEAVADLDLVELQIRIARGEELPLDQEFVDRMVSGWAIECRIYAEDPAQGFLPQSGKLLHWEEPKAEWLRIDAGVESGTEVSIHYDPMLAKVITWGASRGDAVSRMRWALTKMQIVGVRTNRDFLIQVLEHDAFERGEIHTHFVDEECPPETEIDPALRRLASVAVSLAEQQERARTRPGLQLTRTGFRNNPFAPQHATYEIAGEAIEVFYRDLGQSRFEVVAPERETASDESATSETFVVRDWDGQTLALQDARGWLRHVRVFFDESLRHVRVGKHSLTLAVAPRFPMHAEEGADGGCVAPMPGKVVKVLVSEGESVSAGQTLVIMEAMKMEHSLSAAEDGAIAEVRVSEGDQVDEGQILVVVESASEE